MLACLLSSVLVLAGCGQTARETTRLRVTNGGRTPITMLTVIFPEERIGFGDIPAGATTSYREAAHGVYRYAAYSLEVDGALVTQPVIDWVGEEPLDGTSFTYTLETNPLGSPFEIVTLVGVVRDD